MDLVTCRDEGIFSGALTRGKRYPVLARDKDKRQIRVRGDNGRARWFPFYCFDSTGADLPMIMRIDLSDLPDLTEEALSHAVDVGVELTDGQRRWCSFATPEVLSRLSQADLGSERLLMYGAPDMIVVSAITSDSIEQALRYIESQDRLLACTRTMCLSEVDDDDDQQSAASHAK